MVCSAQIWIFDPQMAGFWWILKLKETLKVHGYQKSTLYTADASAATRPTTTISNTG